MLLHQRDYAANARIRVVHARKIFNGHAGR
jgi:hypothetical protein